MKPHAHVMTATPTYTGDVVSDYAAALCLASAHCLQRGIWIDPTFAPGFSLVEYGRNWLVAEFLSRPQCTHLFWVDADLFFDPTAIARLVNWNMDVVCGVYPMKLETGAMYPYTAVDAPPHPTGLLEAERVAGGFMCMKRHVVKTVADACVWHNIEHNGETRLSPRFFDLQLREDKLVGEDFIAGERIRQAGFKIFIDSNITFKHYGRRAWSGNLSRALNERTS